LSREGRRRGIAEGSKVRGKNGGEEDREIRSVMELGMRENECSREKRRGEK